MSQENLGIPTVIGRAEKSRGYWSLSILCPHCHRTHTHGGGNGSKPDAGHRGAHCGENRNETSHLGYFIEVSK